MYNLQGDVIALIDASGNIVVEYKYDAWGQVIGRTGSLVSTLGYLNPFRYRGYIYDEETGLYYLRSRYYNPEWGRFINADVLLGKRGALLSHNLFAYCKNVPVMRLDCSGYADKNVNSLITEITEITQERYLTIFCNEAEITKMTFIPIELIHDIIPGKIVGDLYKLIKDKVTEDIQWDSLVERFLKSGYLEKVISKQFAKHINNWFAQYSTISLLEDIADTISELAFYVDGFKAYAKAMENRSGLVLIERTIYYYDGRIVEARVLAEWGAYLDDYLDYQMSK